MESSLELPPDAHAEYMLGILGYSTWNIYAGERQIGQVTINGPDGTAFFTPFVDGEPVTRAYPWHNFRWWMKWLRTHRQARIL